MDKETAIAQLNAATKQERLEAARALKKHIDSGQIRTLPDEGYTNNHVHTTYSYSPYSPAKAVYMAVLNGLSTVGIIDHDAIGGAEEFIAAGEIFGIATTIGFEIRTDWSDTRLRGRRINNPDQVSSAYICAHGLPHGSIAKADAYLRNIRQARDKRSKKIVGNINGIAQPLGISIDFETDVLPLSFAHDGGGVTERHLLSALTNKMMKKFGKGQRMVDVLCGSFGIELGVSQLAYLTDEGNEMYAYDLLNVFKSILIKDIYVEFSLPGETRKGQIAATQKSGYRVHWIRPEKQVQFCMKRVAQKQFDNNLFIFNLSGEATKPYFILACGYACSQLITKFFCQPFFQAKSGLIVYSRFLPGDRKSLSQFFLRKALHPNKQPAAVPFTTGPGFYMRI